MIGTVEYNLDPEYQGRLKVRIFGVNDQKEDGEYIIPTEMLPWAVPMSMGNGGSATGGGAFSVPKVGSTVNISGSMNFPVWYGNTYVSDEVVSEISKTGYTNSHVLIYDTDFNNGDVQIKNNFIKVYFTESKGFNIEYKFGDGISTINISPAGEILISNNNGDSVSLNNGTINILSSNTVNVNSPLVELSDQATEAVLKGETVKNIFNSHTHTCNSGETTPPMQKIPTEALNRHVKI